MMWCGRARNGEIMAATTSYPSLSPLLVEAMTLRWSLALEIDLGFRRVCVETNCLQLCHWWKKGVEGRSYLATIIRDCRSYVNVFYSFCFSFVRHCGHLVADFLAKDASTYADLVWVEEVSESALSLVNIDVISSRSSLDTTIFYVIDVIASRSSLPLACSQPNLHMNWFVTSTHSVMKITSGN